MNQPKYIIKQNITGYYEVFFVAYKGIFKKIVLVPYLVYSGTNRIYEFTTLDSAIRELKNEVIKNTEVL